MEKDLLERAIAFAAQAHDKMTRKDGSPYILHPLEDMTIVGTMTFDHEILAAAVLHDVIEDTDVTEEDLRAAFGDRVARLVQHETAPSDRNLTWRERKTIQLKQLMDAPYDSKIVALGDKLSNMQGIALDYRRIGDATWSLFHAPNGKKDVEWYYRSLVEALSDLSETAAYKEFVKMLKEVFE